MLSPISLHFLTLLLATTSTIATPIPTRNFEARDANAPITLSTSKDSTNLIARIALLENTLGMLLESRGVALDLERRAAFFGEKPKAEGSTQTVTTTNVNGSCTSTTVSTEAQAASSSRFGFGGRKFGERAANVNDEDDDEDEEDEE